MIYTGKRLFAGLTLLALLPSHAIAQEEPHAWCTALIMQYAGGDSSKDYISEFANRLDGKFDLKGYDIEKAKDNSALMISVENNEVDFAILPKAMAVGSDRMQVIWSDQSGETALVASPMAYEMGYAYRDLLGEAAALEERATD